MVKLRTNYRHFPRLLLVSPPNHSSLNIMPVSHGENYFLKFTNEPMGSGSKVLNYISLLLDRCEFL